MSYLVSNMDGPPNPGQKKDGAVAKIRLCPNQESYNSEPDESHFGEAGNEEFPVMFLNDMRHDWKYHMRRMMQEVHPRIYLGPYASATKRSLKTLQAVGITHIVCVREQQERVFIRPNHPNAFEYLVVEVADSPYENIICHFKMVVEFLQKCVQQGGRALVHGNSGISRSSTLAIAYVMSARNVGAREALRLVQERRFCANPNPGFLRQLEEWELIVKAKFNSNKFEDSQRGLKRKFDDDDEAMDDSTPGTSQAIFPAIT